MGVALVAWLLHVAALAIAPITLVQVAISGGLVLVAVAAERWFGISVGRKQWVALVAMAVGLALVSATAPAPKGAHSAYSVPGMLAFQTVILIAGAICLAAPRVARRARYAVVLGASAGALFAASDAALKALTKHVGDHGPAGLLTPWLIPCVLASVMGFFASARSLQDEDAVAVISLTTVGSTVATFIGGVLVFRDPMASEPFLLALQLAGFVCVCVAAALIPAPVRAAGELDPGGAQHEGERFRRAGPVLADEPGAGAAQDRAQDERDGDRVVELAGDRDHVGHEVEGHREVAEQEPQQGLAPPGDA